MDETTKEQKIKELHDNLYSSHKETNTPIREMVYIYKYACDHPEKYPSARKESKQDLELMKTELNRLLNDDGYRIKIFSEYKDVLGLNQKTKQFKLGNELITEDEMGEMKNKLVEDINKDPTWFRKLNTQYSELMGG